MRGREHQSIAFSRTIIKSLAHSENLLSSPTLKTAPFREMLNSDAFKTFKKTPYPMIIS